MNYTVQLDSGPDRGQDEEAFVVTFADGRSERMRLHDYERLYAIPGLYEEVVQQRLQCGSPAKVADVIVRAAHLGDLDGRSLRVLDVARRKRGCRGAAARARGRASGGRRQRCGRPRRRRARPAWALRRVSRRRLTELHHRVRELDLNCLVCVAALGFDHFPAVEFAQLWDAFAPGGIFAITVNEELAEAGAPEP